MVNKVLYDLHRSTNGGVTEISDYPLKWEAGRLFVILGRSAFRMGVGNLQIDLAGPRSARLRLHVPGNLPSPIEQSPDSISWAVITNVVGSVTMTNDITGSSAKFFRALLGK